MCRFRVPRARTRRVIPILRSETERETVMMDEPPDYERWMFYLAVLEWALRVAIWLNQIS